MSAAQAAQAAHMAYLESHPKVTIASNGSFVPDRHEGN